MVTYEQIAKANETIKTMPIKGKEYAMVNQRIKAFRMCYPEGFISTELVSDADGVCLFRANVGYHLDDGTVKVLGTGTAFERAESSYINKTSYIENCETSAVGRALGMAGFGIDVSVASAEEVENAINQQEGAKKKDDKRISLLCVDCGNGLMDEVGKDGKTVTAKKFAEYSSTHADDGKVRCRACYEKYIKVQQAREDEISARISAKLDEDKAKRNAGQN